LYSIISAAAAAILLLLLLLLEILFCVVAIDVKSCRSLMSVFGAECSAACLQALINNCLSAAIPSTRSELAGFTKVVTVVEELQSKLVRFGFISEENGTLVEYVKNVDSLFANKRCVQLLDEARKLIKSDIHNIVQVVCHNHLILNMQLCTTSLLCSIVEALWQLIVVLLYKLLNLLLSNI